MVEEIRHGIERWGFRSFKFRDPLFGLNRKHVFRLADLLDRLPHKIQFSIETRIELMRPEVLRVLKRVGLTSITVGIETPDETTLRRYHRATIREDRQRDFVAQCRTMGIRTVAGFMLGFPDDTEESIRNVLRYAKAVNPTFANFNLVTPYPGTEFFEEMRERITSFDFRDYTVYTPVLQYAHLSAERVQQLHTRSFLRFYFRWKYLRDNARLLWPRLATLLPRRQGVDGRQGGPPAPLGKWDASRGKTLRSDSPHLRPDAADSRADRQPRD